MATQKQNNFGIKNTAIKNGKVCIVVNYYDDNGKRKQFCKTTDIPAKDVGRGRKKEVEKLRDEIVEQFYKDKEEKDLIKKMSKENPFYQYKEMTFLELLNAYLDYKQSRNKHTILTRDNYLNFLNVIKQYLLTNNIENIKMKDITTDFLENFYSNYLPKRVTNKGTTLSANTIIHYMNFINPALQWAYKKDWIEKDPTKTIEKPQIIQKERNALSKDEAVKLFKYLDDKEMGFAIQIGMMLGLRRSEILGIKTNAIDLINNNVAIHDKLLYKSGLYITSENDTKSNKNNESKGLMPLMTVLNSIISKQLARIEYNKSVLGSHYNKEFEDYLCVDNEGNIYKPDRLTRTAERYAKECLGKKYILHEICRHTCATLLVSDDTTLSEVQHFLRHSSINTTSAFYTHLAFSDRIPSANKIEEILTGKKEQQKSEEEKIEKTERN
ncbi:MAG: tyrosine-type recombinase/integrase [Clostridia bacterium]|nr:tyrosine-type recombinase/integrase [Clostridia bacterium]